MSVSPRRRTTDFVGPVSLEWAPVQPPWNLRYATHGRHLPYFQALLHPLRARFDIETTHTSDPKRPPPCRSSVLVWTYPETVCHPPVAHSTQVKTSVFSPNELLIGLPAAPWYVQTGISSGSAPILACFNCNEEASYPTLASLTHQSPLTTSLTPSNVPPPRPHPMSCLPKIFPPTSADLMLPSSISPRLSNS